MLYVRTHRRREGCTINSQLLNELYRAYYREIFLYLFSMCRNRDLAEDLAQDTFLKALLSLGNSHANVKAWLFTVARNLWYNRYNADKKTADVCPDDLPLADANDLLSDMIRKEENRSLYLALNRLSGNRRDVLVMYYFGGLSQKEIASILKMTPSNVRVLTLRAKQELKRYLEVDDNDIP